MIISQTVRKLIVRLGITGSRSNTNFDFMPLFSYCIEEFNAFLKWEKITSIITGGACGIDRQAEQCAVKLNFPCQIIRPDYVKYHKAAPLKRDLQIAAQCDALLAVWNGDCSSRGTIYTAKSALKFRKPVFLIFSTGETINECIGEIRDERVFAVSKI